MIYTADGQVWAGEVRQEEQRRKMERRAVGVGENLASAVAGLDVPFPWETALRAFSPIVELVSHLRPYFYYAAHRWVLYECIPLALLPDDDRLVRVDLTGRELFAFLRGKPPRERTATDPSPISDVQHEMGKRYQVWAAPMWVLQGTDGGHPHKLGPWAQNLALAKRLPTEMPAIGSLPPCPFDDRVTRKLRARDRLVKLGGRLDKLRASGSKVAWDAEMDGIQREIRDAEMAFIEETWEPVVDMVQSLVRGPNTRSEYEDQVVRVKPGTAARASEAYDRYKETGLFTRIEA